VVGCWLAILAATAFGLADLKIDTTTDSVLNTDSAAWAYYQQSQARFGGDQILVVALPGLEPFDESLLAEVDQLSARIERLEGVRRVDSLSTVPVISGEPDGTLNLDPAISIPIDGDAVARRIAHDRIAPRSLISDDGKVFALNVLIERNYSDYRQIVSTARQLTSQLRTWISGVPVFRSTASARTQRELFAFVPMTILVVGGLLAVAYRSVRMTFLALSIGAIGTWVVVATMGLLSVPLSLVTLLLPSIMLALGCAYSIHMLSAARGPSNYLGDRLKHVALPVALSSLTTAIGFSAIGTIAIDEVRYVGGFGALGALVLGIATLTVAPALLTLWETKVDFEPPRLVTSRLRPLIVRIATKRARTALVVWLGVLAILAIGIWRVDVVSDPTKWFRPGSEVRDSYESIGMELSGISPVNVVVESDSGDSVTSPAALSAIDGLTTFLEEIPYVGKATSIRDPLRQLHGGFSDDDSYPLPVEPNLAEQYLLLLESVEQISDLVLADRSAANILLRVNDNGSEALLEIERRADQWWAQHGPQGFTARTTGIMYEFARAQNEISYGQLRGLTLAFIAIGITMLLALRSFRLAFLSMVPNVVPTAMVFGVMGWLSMPLDAGTVVIGSLALGIAVDDTIHLVSGFHEGLEAGRSSAEALGEAVDRVLHPVILTTVAIGLGFGLFGFSGFTLTRNVGLLLAGIAVVCLLADLFLLPALLTLASNVRSKS
jgi:hypothetical protein